MPPCNVAVLGEAGPLKQYGDALTASQQREKSGEGGPVEEGDAPESTSLAPALTDVKLREGFTMTGHQIIVVTLPKCFLVAVAHMRRTRGGVAATEGL